MSAFVDATLLRFTQDPFIADMLTNGIGLSALFNAAFQANDIQPQSFTLGQLSARAYKVPIFDSVRSKGTDERIVPDTQRVQVSRVWSRLGRLDWIDVTFDAILNSKVQTLLGPLQNITVQTLEQKLGGVASVDDLRAKLLTLYAPSVVDAIFAKLTITTLADFETRRHLFIELVGAAPPVFDPNDPSTQRNFTVSLRVKIADGFDVAGALQAAKSSRSILDSDAWQSPPNGVEVVTPYIFITLFDNSAVTDTSLPGMTAAQAKTAVQTLFSGERMFAQFIT
jgi:hypothetical protein